VNKNNLTKGLFTTLLLVSSVVSADEKYPAADFQPSVVYQSDAVKNGASTQAAVKQAAPVAAQEKQKSMQNTPPLISSQRLFIVILTISTIKPYLLARLNI